MTIDVRREIEAQLKQRKLDAIQKGKPANRRITIADAEQLFDNQPQAMKQHLIHDCAHRMLADNKSKRRSARPAWVDRRAEQMRETQ